MKKLTTSVVLTAIMLFAISANPSFASTEISSEKTSYLKFKEQQNQKSAKRFSGKMDDNEEAPSNETVDIAINELVGIEGFECFAGAVYRFSTTSEFRSTALDVLLTIEDSIDLVPVDLGRIDPVTGELVQVTEPCVRADEGRIAFWIGGRDRPAFADINYQVVEAGTNIPVRANVITMTALDLDTDPQDDEVGTDNIFLQSPTTLLVSPDSQVTSEAGNFFIDFTEAGEPFFRYTDALIGTPDSNCGDTTEIADITCCGAASWYSNNIGISDVTFRIRNEFSTNNEERLFVVSFRLEDSIGLDNISPTAIITTSGATRGLSPLQVDFSGTDSFDPDGDIVEYLWDFGDGATSTGAETSHSFTFEPCEFSFCSTDRDFEVSLTIIDDQGARATTARTITVDTDVDSEENSSPVIRLLGDSLVFIAAGEPYVEAGAVAEDDLDGLIPVVISANSVDTNVPGEYRVSYNATDSAGARAPTIFRVVRVGNPLPEVDTTPPVVTLVGPATVTIDVGVFLLDPGASATDDVDGALQVIEENNVDSFTPGVYTIVYTATDSAGNTGSATRTVTVLAPPVIDTVAPVITVIGGNPVDSELNNVYVDLGATATDNIDNNVLVTSSGTVDITEVGVYIISYSASDSAGNIGTATRTVNVVDNPTCYERCLPTRYF